MTFEESKTILKGDATGLEFMGEEVFNVCDALIDIIERECCYYNHEKEIEWARAFMVSYERIYGEG